MSAAAQVADLNWEMVMNCLKTAIRSYEIVVSEGNAFALHEMRRKVTQGIATMNDSALWAVELWMSRSPLQDVVISDADMAADRPCWRCIFLAMLRRICQGSDYDSIPLILSVFARTDLENSIAGSEKHNLVPI